MRIYICPICGRSLMPHPDIYKYRQPIAGQSIPCGCQGWSFAKILPLATPQETKEE